VLLRVELRALQPVCDAPERAAGGPDHGLGAGVLTDPRPSHAAPPGGEPTIEQQAPRGLARLARMYQPTVETTVADRFWPVSVSAVLAERGPDDKPVCLVVGGQCAKREPTLGDLARSGRATDYLDLPAPLSGDPTQQFLAFTSGQGIEPEVARGWLASPTAIRPWDTAQLYFYYAGSADRQTRYGPQRSGTIALQYWFFYPYNYYPTRVDAGLMGASPLAGDHVNTDLHEGDWEHVVVLLDAVTKAPRALYLARHDTEGVTIPWTSPTLSFDGTHPIVQAAFGGHPSYVNTCRGFPRARLKGQSSDWVSCGTGRYAFPAATTPLVDLARASWACWPGHFGEAQPRERTNAAIPDFDAAVWSSKLLKVAGPQSPLRQAENAGVCARGPVGPEVTFR
jgi:hypothetical protein